LFHSIPSGEEKSSPQRHRVGDLGLQIGVAHHQGMPKPPRFEVKNWSILVNVSEFVGPTPNSVKALMPSAVPAYSQLWSYSPDRDKKGARDNRCRGVL